MCRSVNLADEISRQQISRANLAKESKANQKSGCYVYMEVTYSHFSRSFMLGKEAKIFESLRLMRIQAIITLTQFDGFQTIYLVYKTIFSIHILLFLFSFRLLKVSECVQSAMPSTSERKYLLYTTWHKEKARF